MTEIRQACTSEDVAAVRTLLEGYGEHLRRVAHICLGESYAEELRLLPGAFAGPEGRLLIAFLDGQAVGCVGLKPVVVDADRCCEVKRLWVDASARGFGVGRALMKAAVDEARGLGYAALYLDTVASKMPEAIRMYAAMGFVQVERYNKNPVEDVIFFRLGLRQ